LQEVETARPLTYDLFINVLRALGARILQIEVVALRNDTFIGNIVIEINGEIIHVDSRPSDAINLAVRVGAPIFVAREVMEIAGGDPEADEIQLDDYLSEREPEDGAPPPEESEERLSVFEDFLEQLIDDEDQKSA